jgi:twitching motility protein PilI
LRDFQTELVERMQAARSSSESAASQLGVLIGSARWLIDLQEVGEIVSVDAIAKVPLAQDWYLGLANIRGNLIGVIDMGIFMGLPPTEVGTDSRIVTFASRLGFNCGLLVTRVLGLRNTAGMELQVEAAFEEQSWAAQHYVDSETAYWTRLQLARLVQEPRFLKIGA